MGEPVFWEDVEEGMAIPTIVKVPSTRQLVQYAGASGDFYEIHYDKDYAQGTGLPGVIIHGALKNAFLAQLVTDWIGEQGDAEEAIVRVPRYGCAGRHPYLPGNSDQEVYSRWLAIPWTARYGSKTARVSAPLPDRLPSSCPLGAIDG